MQSRKVTAASAALMLLVGVAVWSVERTADARPQHKKEWDAKYLKEGTAIHKALGGKSNCNLCHQGAKSKKVRNDYGKALEPLLGMANQKDAAIVQKALDDAAAQKSKADDDASKTFGELIEEGTLPVTTAEPAAE